MKKKATVLIASIMAFCGINTAHADEGMWTIYNLPKAVYEMMQREGFSMTYDQLYNGENALKNAVVNFSGYCSGVVVSPNGLVFTNHHCGFEAIRSHSTVEHDYMLNGFFAKSYAEELPNENMFVSFMVEQKDVTDKVMSLGYDKLDNKKRDELIDSLENEMTKEVKKNDSTLHITVQPFYEGNKWYATTYRDFTDLRLVFTVPEQELPTQWYNIQADMPNKPLPPLNPQTHQPMNADDLSHVFNKECSKQELDTEHAWIDIPEDVLEKYTFYRSTPLVRAYALEEALGTPAHIYFKNESINPLGSHKINSAIPQCYYCKQEGDTNVTTETGAGQWGAALSYAAKLYGLEAAVYQVKITMQQKPYRSSIMRTFGEIGRASCRERV